MIPAKPFWRRRAKNECLLPEREKRSRTADFNEIQRAGTAQRGAEPRIRDLGGACPTRRELLWGCPVRLVHSPQSAGRASRSLIVIGLHLRDRSKNPFGLQAQIRCQLQENSSRENHLLAIHTDQPAKPEYMSRARMRVKQHKIAAAPPIKFFSC